MGHLSSTPLCAGGGQMRVTTHLFYSLLKLGVLQADSLFPTSVSGAADRTYLVFH